MFSSIRKPVVMRILCLLFVVLWMKPLAQTGEGHCLVARYTCVFNEDFDRGSFPVPYHSVLYAWPSHSYFLAVRDPRAEKMPSVTDLALQPDTLWRTAKWLDQEAMVFGTFGFDGREAFYQDSLHIMSWTRAGESRRMDSLDCFKATTVFRGRSYTAWYAPSIPLANGPWKFGGLPGLIVELYDDKKDLHFRLVSLTTAHPSHPYRDIGPYGRYGSYVTYEASLRKSIRQIEDMIAAQRQEGCIDCQTQSKVNIFFWEKLPR